MIAVNKILDESLRNIYYNGINLRVGWQTDKDGDSYHQLYNYPIYGLGFYASTFRKAEIGTPTALYGFVSVPIHPGRFRRWDFNYRISLGLASNFEPYDEENNPLNVLLGSHRNVSIELGIQANYKLSTHLQMGAGLSFHHFSNGSIRQPNKGINLLPLSVTLTYIPYRESPDFGQTELPELDENGQVHLHYAFGIKQFEPRNRKRYFKSTVGIYWSYAVGYKWRLGVGGDLFYSDSGNQPEIAGDALNKMGAMFSGGPAFYVDHVLTKRLYLNGNVGVYIHRNDFNGEIKPVFLRIGTRYKVWKNAYAGISIKAHTAKADFVEWTMGYTLQRKAR
ncbi:acyloxyacyl hydrolase [Parapedobacter defluvii]|uniref:acyloxyacyl hydrolase n=1 Tax=Parapedobacter defluvii TaxID=2045106 RepID=UPI00334027D7